MFKPLISIIVDLTEGICTFITIFWLCFILVFAFGLPVIAQMGITMNLWHAFTLVALATALIFFFAFWIRCFRGVWFSQFNRNDLKFLHYTFCR